MNSIAQFIGYAVMVCASLAIVLACVAMVLAWGWDLYAQAYRLQTKAIYMRGTAGVNLDGGNHG
jgi:hypothetical protein